MDKLNIAKRDDANPYEIASQDHVDYQQLSNFDNSSIRVSDYLSKNDSDQNPTNDQAILEDRAEFEENFDGNTESQEDPFLDFEDEDFEVS